MAQADKLAISDGISEMQLIRNAGLCLAEELMKLLPQGKLVFCCGGGNNGADGYISAFHLAKAGYQVFILPLTAPDKLTGERAQAAQQALQLSQILREEIPKDADLIIDALFGTGLNREPKGAAARLIAAMNNAKTQKVAVDIPSGLSADSAVPLGTEAVRAHTTITFFRPKLAHYLYPGAGYCGKVICRQIGIKENLLTRLKPSFFLNEAPLLPSPQASSHKYNRGHTLIIAGESLQGAGALCAAAAQRAGAGLVSLISCEQNAPLMRALLPASCIVRSADSLEGAAQNWKAAAALIGPGSGSNARTVRTTLELAAEPLSLLLDADALSAFATQPQLLFDSLAERDQQVLTPHSGEFSRLFPEITGANKVEKSLAAARQSHSVIVLKGADTVIASPTGRVSINPAASPHLATGGSGDVLGGIIVSLMAQGMDAFAASCAGVFIHSRCALRAGRNLIPEDLIALLPSVCGELQGDRGHGKRE